MSELAKPFDMSLPAVVQHLRALEASGLVKTAAKRVFCKNGPSDRASACPTTVSGRSVRLVCRPDSDHSVCP